MSIASSGTFYEMTPDDDNDLAAVTRGIALGTAGDLKVTREDGEVVTIPSGVLTAGMIHPVRILRLHETGTTAADIWGFF